MTTFSMPIATLAMGASPEGGAGGAPSILFVYVIIFFIFYMLLIRPQQQKVKQHDEMLKALAKGDEVITSGGIHGKVHGLTEQIVTLEIAPNVRIKVSRARVEGKATADGGSASGGKS